MTERRDEIPRQPGIYRLTGARFPVLIGPEWLADFAFWLDTSEGYMRPINPQELPEGELQWEALWLQT